MSTKNQYIAIDVETNKEAIHGDLTHMWCIAFAQLDQETNEVRVQGFKLDWSLERIEEYTGGVTYSAIQSILDQCNPVFHNASFDIWVLTEFGLEVPEVFDDTQLMSYVSYPDRPPVTVQKKKWSEATSRWTTRNVSSRHSLASWGVRLGEYKTQIESDFDMYTDEMLEYNKQDAKVTILAFHYLYDRLRDSSAWDCYTTIEIPFVRVLINMRNNGMLIDRKRHEEFIKELEEKESEIYQEITELIGGEFVEGSLKRYKKPHPELEIKGEGGLVFKGYDETKKEYVYRQWILANPGSNKHIGQLLITQGWEPTVFNKDGSPKADKATLELLAPDYELVRKLMEWRKIHKLTSTYGHSILEKLKDDDRLYCNWNQSIAITGRLSSSKPNLQNIPSRDELGAQVRKSFIASPGFKIVSIDISQFQIRILANYLTQHLGDSYSDANVMTDEFNNTEDADPHQAVADLIGIPRKPAKNVNFGNIFGFGAHKLASMVNCSLAQARKFIKTQREAMPSIGHLKQKVWSHARSNNGTVFTLYSRRGVYPSLFSDDSQERARAERQSFNFLIQGTEADIMKLIMCEVYELLMSDRWKMSAYLIGQIHDEILFEVLEAECEQFAEEVIDIVERDWLPRVRMKANYGVSDNWLEAH